MKYTFVYREDPQGYNWTVMNTHGLYAAFGRADRPYIRRWRTGAGAHAYMTEHRHCNDPEDLVWAQWPTDKPTPTKRVTTAASYKPTHGGYPDRTALKNAKRAESYGDTYTGRFRSSVGPIEKAAASAPVRGPAASVTARISKAPIGDEVTPIYRATTAPAPLPPHNGLTVKVGADGVWLAFVASTGRSALLNVERIADSHGSITGKALRDWAADVSGTAPLMANGLTEAETGATASVAIIDSPDDGSNEEATTVPDALVAELSECPYVDTCF